MIHVWLFGKFGLLQFAAAPQCALLLIIDQVKFVVHLDLVCLQGPAPDHLAVENRAALLAAGVDPTGPHVPKLMQAVNGAWSKTNRIEHYCETAPNRAELVERISWLLWAQMTTCHALKHCEIAF